MRAGLAASGPGAAFEAMLRLQGYGFVLQPTDTARAVTEAHVSRLQGAAPRLPRLSS